MTSDIDTDSVKDFIREWLRGDFRDVAKEIGVSENSIQKALRKNVKQKTQSRRTIEKLYPLAVEKCNKWIAMKEQTNILKEKINSL
jgi:hypothetical protein